MFTHNYVYNKIISLKHNLTVSSCRHLLEYFDEVMIVLHLDLQPCLRYIQTRAFFLSLSWVHFTGGGWSGGSDGDGLRLIAAATLMEASGTEVMG